MAGATDTIPIELDQAERHALIHLLNHYVRQRSWEVIRAAHRASEIHEGVEAARLLAELHGLTEDDGSLRVDDLEAHRANVILRVEETEVTVDNTRRESPGGNAWGKVVGEHLKRQRKGSKGESSGLANGQ